MLSASEAAVDNGSTNGAWGFEIEKLLDKRTNQQTYEQPRISKQNANGSV